MQQLFRLAFLELKVYQLNCVSFLLTKEFPGSTLNPIISLIIKEAPLRVGSEPE